MALTEQVVSFPLVGGVDEDAHPRLCSRLLVMNNCRQFESGALGKRYGTTCVGKVDKYLGTGPTFLPAGELLCALKDDVVRVGAGQVASFNPIGTSTDYAFKGRASEALVYRRNVTPGDAAVLSPDVAYGTNTAGTASYTVLVCVTVDDPTGASGNAAIVAYVYDANGAAVISRQVIASGLSSALFQCPRVVIDGIHCVITWTEGTALKACHLSLDTLTVTVAATTLVATMVSTHGYASAVISGSMAIVYETGAGVIISTWNTSTLANLAGSTVAATTGITSFAVAGYAGTVWFVGYGYISGGTNVVVSAAARQYSTLASVLSATQIENRGEAHTVINLSCAIDSTGLRAQFVWSELDLTLVTSDSSVRWRSVTTGGTLGSNYVSYKSLVVSGCKIVSLANIDTLYAYIRPFHSTHATLFLAALHTADDLPVTSVGARIVATAAPRQVPIAAWLYGTGSGPPSIATVSAGRYVYAGIVSGAVVDSMVVALLDTRIGDTKPVACEAGGLLILSGGCPSAYDGASVAELGFAWEPDYARIGVSAASGGNLNASSTYYYLFIYEWRYANGSTVRSIPSYPVSYRAVDDSGAAIGIASRGLLTLTTTGTNKKGTLTFDGLRLSNKQFADTKDGSPWVAIYRTVAGGSTFYRATTVPVPYETRDKQSVNTSNTYVDNLSDSDLAKRPFIYVAGGALASEIPPSSAHVALIGNRVWLSSTEDDSIWFSNEIVDGEAPTFSGSLTIAPFGSDRVVAMASLDDKKVILKERSLYYIFGDGPGIDGLNGTFSSPVLIPSDVGCTDARSVVSTTAGVMFQSQNGLALIGHDLQVSLIGKGVADTAGATAITAACVVPTQNLVRFSVSGTATTVEYDLFHGGAWGTNTYADPDPTNTGAQQYIVGMTYSRGAWWYLNSFGNLFKETTTDWCDRNGANTSYVVQRAQLRYLSLGDIQGFARVWYVSVDAERKSSHDFTVIVRADEELSTTQTQTWTSVTVNSWGRHQAQVHVARQECEGVSVEVKDATPSDASLTDGRGFVLFGVSAEVGLEKPMRRLPAAQTG